MSEATQKIQEYLNSEDGKAVFSEMLKKEIETKGYKSPVEITGLANKNRELLAEISKKNAEKKKSDEKLLTILEKYAILDVDELDDVLSSSSKSTKGKPDETERTLKKFEREAATERQRAEEANKQLTQIRQQYYQAEKSRTILSALSKAGVDDVYADVLGTYFDKVVKVEEDAGKLSFIAEDGAQSKPFADYFQDWTKSEKSKHYIKATVSTGAGSTAGSNGKSLGKMTLDQIEKITDKSDRVKAMIENGYLNK
jgi:hypothetical protein